MSTVVGLLLGQLVSHFRAGHENAVAEHAKRSDESQAMDEDLEASHMTGDITEWINNPDSTDFIGVDDPHLSDTTYDPLGEWE